LRGGTGRLMLEHEGGTVKKLTVVFD
jgi:hypothetical protein